MGKNRSNDSSSSGSGDSSGNPLRGIFTSVADHVFKALPIAIDRYMKQKLAIMKNKKEENTDRRELSNSYSRNPDPYRRTRNHVIFDDELAYRHGCQGEENAVNGRVGTHTRLRERVGAGRTKIRGRNNFEAGDRRKHSHRHHHRHNFHRHEKHKEHTTLQIQLPFSDEVMHAGAVGIIAGATTALRLRSAENEWLGEKWVRVGSSAAAAAVASLVVGHETPTDLIREVGLPVVLGLGMDHMLWE
jgi:hypothetical protein